MDDADDTDDTARVRGMAESGIRRLVIRAPNWLGDAVMALPAMEAVRQAFGDAHVAVAAIPSIAPLFAEETSAGPDSVIALPDPAAEVQALRAGSFDAILLLPELVSVGVVGPPRVDSGALGLRGRASAMAPDATDLAAARPAASVRLLP